MSSHVLSLDIVQILFLSGVATTIGPRSTLKFFTKRRNYRGSGAFLGGACRTNFRTNPYDHTRARTHMYHSLGFALVLLGWAMTGMAAQSYGFVLLFADFLPTALPFARRVPVLGYVLSLPPVRAVRAGALSGGCV